MIYWERGTHYFTPLDEKYGTRKQHIAHLQRPTRPERPQRPTREVYVAGEAVSAHQGWCEGALEFGGECALRNRCARGKKAGPKNSYEANKIKKWLA